MQTADRCASSTAFSLIELLVVLAILSMISTIGLPNLQELWHRLQAEHFMRQLSHHLVYARVHRSTAKSSTDLSPSWHCVPARLEFCPHSTASTRFERLAGCITAGTLPPTAEPQAVLQQTVTTISQRR